MFVLVIQSQHNFFHSKWSSYEKDREICPFCEINKTFGTGLAVMLTWHLYFPININNTPKNIPWNNFRIYPQVAQSNCDKCQHVIGVRYLGGLIGG